MAAMKLTRQLSQMRGAAMKIGQMISMESGDFLPKEFADILARLRADAKHMPRKQLLKVLDEAWGRGWRAKFKSFDMQPIAAASIGQVCPTEHSSRLKFNIQVCGKVLILMTLTLRELFDLRVMQTDPNFANYQYNKDAAQIVLLDFGASRDIGTSVSETYRALMAAALSGDSEATFDAAVDIGFIPAEMKAAHRSVILELIELIIEPLTRDEPFDFGDPSLAQDLRDKAMPLATKRDLWHVPPTEMIFIQRKLGGMYMLATRLKAVVDVSALLEQFVGA